MTRAPVSSRPGPRAAAQVPAERIFRALSDPIRLRIVQLLGSAGGGFHDGRIAGEVGEVCVCDLVRVIGAPQPTISRHLRYLRGSGLVLQRKRGLWKYYRLAPPASKLHAGVLASLDTCRDEFSCCVLDARRLGSCCDGQSGERQRAFGSRRRTDSPPKCRVGQVDRRPG